MRAAAILWTGFVVALEVDGTWQRLEGDLIALSAYAGAIALLAYAVDDDTRAALERFTSRSLVLALFGLAALGWTAPRSLALLVALPAFGLAVLALARRIARASVGAAPFTRPDRAR